MAVCELCGGDPSLCHHGPGPSGSTEEAENKIEDEDDSFLVPMVIISVGLITVMIILI